MTWFLVFFIGLVVVFVANALYSGSHNRDWLTGGTVILLGLMVLYSWVVYNNPDVSIDIKADGIYYLGLLFTFAALVATLIFSGDSLSVSEQLLSNFGIALITTIVGLAGRVWFTMVQNSPGDLSASATQSLSDAAAAMKTQIVKAEEKMEELVWHLTQSVNTWQEAFKEIRALPESVKNANEHFQGATNRFSETMEDLFKPLKDADQRLSQLNVQYDQLGKAIVQTQTQLSSFNISELTNGIFQFQKEVTGTLQYLGRFQTSLERSCNYVSDFGRKIQQESLTLDGLAITGIQIEELGAKLSTFANALASLQSKLNNIVRTSEMVSGTVTRNGEIIQHASDVIDQASDPFRQMETTINNLPNEVVNLHKEVVHLSDSLTIASKKSEDLQEKLDIAHKYIPSPIVSRVRKWIKWLKHRWARDSKTDSGTITSSGEIIHHGSDLFRQSDESHDTVPEKANALQDSYFPSDWWLRPEKIRSSEYLNDVFCLGYRIGQSVDNWTVRINQFKAGKSNVIKKAAATLRAAAPSLFRRINIDPRDTIVMPVLGSQETSGDANSKNSHLAKAIASGAGAKFVLDCLQKDKHPPLHLQPSAHARDQALNNANYRASRLNCKNVIIVDDIVTRGATMSEIAKAIHKSNPGTQIFGFALGRHVRPEYSPAQANTNIPQELAEIWDQTQPLN